jgi:nucleotide-binding universal stress UspA family protein
VLRSILVPLDSSSFGEQALPLALSLARRSGARLQVVHVHVALAPTYGDTVLAFDNRLDEALRQGEQAYLDGVVGRVSAAGGVAVTAALLEGSVPDVLREQAAARGADLVVMTTHGRGHMGRFWLGSVADDLVRRLPMPILLVRPSEGPVSLTSEPALRHVLIPLDGSKQAEAIVEPALALGSLTSAEYTLVRVIKPLVIGSYDPAYPAMSGLDQVMLQRLQELHNQERAEAEAYLEGVAGRLRANSLVVNTRVVVHDQAAPAILEEARARHADMIAVETHGRSGFPRLFLGSVADKLVRGSAMPILVHRAAGQ